MHWIKTIREHLELSREDLALYLGLSPHMIQSVEQGRRQLPWGNMGAALAIYNTIRDLKTRRVASVYLPAAENHQRRMKRLHRQCCRKLNRITEKLEAMQRAHASACFRLGVYQQLTGSLIVSRSNSRRIQWTQRKIEETIQHIKDNNATQDLLATEIASLKGLVNALEGM
jgi:transcriptional regulator with XRE-family HTH domain